jgi:integrase
LKGVYTQKNSPYYWLRYYDQLEQDPNRKRKSVNTKIPITPADKKRIIDAKSKGDRPQLLGTPELRKLLREFKLGLAERTIQGKTGVKLIKRLKLSEGYEEFKKARSVPGSKKELKEKTLTNYTIAVDHMIKVCGDKKIHTYTNNYYVKLLFFFEEKGLSKNSRSIYTRALHSLWNYFVEQYYTGKNIIETIDPEEKDPEPIPLEDMYAIINYLKNNDKSPHHYWIISFMLLTGCRTSSAIVQMKQDIDFKRKQITIRNVKAGARKNKNYYRFPLYIELENLLIEMNVMHGDEGRLFDMFNVVPQSYASPLSFWERTMKQMKKARLIEKEYTLKQIRPTLASFLINIVKMDIFSVKKLLDHANIKVTDKHYIDFNVNRVRKELDFMTIDNLIGEAV